MKLLQKEGLAPHAIDWHDVLDVEPIDYFGQQEGVIRRIADMVRLALGDEKFASRLKARVSNIIAAAPEAALSKVVERFGTGGAEKTVEVLDKMLLAPLAARDAPRVVLMLGGPG